MFKKVFALCLILITVIYFSGKLGNGKFFDALTAYGYGGAVISSSSSSTSAASASPVISAVNYPLTISSSQEGTLTQVMGSYNVLLSVPKGAVGETTTFNITSQSLTAGVTPAENVGATLTGTKVFSISTSDNIEKTFLSNLTITITVPSLSSDTSNLGVYYYNNSAKKWILIPGATFDSATGKAKFFVNHLKTFAIFNVAGLPATISTASTGTSTIVESKKEEVIIKTNVPEPKVEQLIKPLIQKANNVSKELENTLNNFIANGSQSTKNIGEGERAGILNSFQKAFNKLPQTNADWQDIAKIANGHFPSQQSITQEKNALKVFGKIYKRLPDFKNQNDEASLKIIAYGIRSTKRKVEAEIFAIKIFKNIFGKNPSNTTDWDIMRAIAYSGAKR